MRTTILFFIALFAICPATIVAETPAAGFDWDLWRTLPVQDGGRQKPLDTLAWETLRTLANRGHYPAIDVLQSISRVQKDVIETKHLGMMRELTDIYATYQDAEDLINIGAYPAGSSAKIDRAIDRIDDINGFLRQSIDESTPPQEMLVKLEKALGGLE